MSILTAFVETAMHEARYKMLEDGTFFGEIPSCPGVWANEKTLEVCRDVLREVLEEWLILKLRDGDFIPTIGGIDLNVITSEA
ncbi:type II toxin-antitoxin system HicB family antitoxin [Acetomicrobium mobile]|uniref:type II toxin-antitoxin system HicB family antitoxin n=1 Tax=Acetomicrobium mobile TaxID=97477 RepID=UPI0026E934FA|nr:type II toxin-antitoxin system HicB family antitoxin [Acetomicrobium mobile]